MGKKILKPKARERLERNIKFKKGKIIIHTQGEGVVEIDGLTTDYGLGFHKPYDERSKGYNITHLESGRFICHGVPNIKAAKAILKRAVLESGIDWTEAGTTLFPKLTQELADQIRSLKYDPFFKGFYKKLNKEVTCK